MPNTQYDDNKVTDSDQTKVARKLLIWLGIHLAGYFLVTLVLVLLNFWLSPDDFWALLPMLGWGSLLALHVAYVMGLFDIFHSD